jgi:hypothetical protein
MGNWSGLTLDKIYNLVYNVYRLNKHTNGRQKMNSRKVGTEIKAKVRNSEAEWVQRFENYTSIDKFLNSEMGTGCEITETITVDKYELVDPKELARVAWAGWDGNRVNID